LVQRRFPENKLLHVLAHHVRVSELALGTGDEAVHASVPTSDGLNDMTALVFPKYNQYDSFIIAHDGVAEGQGA
jgi:hypothetical protein